ncbi:hypothetical protein B0H13DRAFT_1868093 [Mycena leptocephala]|nr:hypothetical protein B0H13DRAFT_1868093 [Mycena leptocephala]
MAILPGTKESYIGTFVENIIYGVYLSVFLECSVHFYKKKARGAVQSYLLITTILMFIFITARCIIDTYRCITALSDFHLLFVWRYQDAYWLADNDDLDFGLPNGLLAVLSDACWLLVSLVADVFIVWSLSQYRRESDLRSTLQVLRTFIVWDRNWLVIIIPSMLCLASTIVSVLGCVSFVQSGSGTISVWRTVDWLNAIIALTLSTNIICTGPSLRGCNGLKHLTPLGQYEDFIHGFATYILIDCLPATIPDLGPQRIQGVVFSSIIIRLSRGTSYGESTGNAAISSFGHYRPNSGTKSDVQIRLERTTHGPVGMEMNGFSANKESDDAKYSTN